MSDREEFEKWFKAEWNADYYPTEAMYLAWQARGALAQPTAEQSSLVQEPVYTNGDRTMSMKDRNFTSEGNGYIQDNNFDFDAGLRIDGDFVNDERDQYAQMICNALNTTPPSREWVGLSDEEIIEKYVPIWGAMINTRDREETVDFGRAIETKLREKNG